ncbi:interphotoreceptor matrix proteoglycan 2-like isoform X2 [Denticeps clupeoides]|uniref:interphotoreceptor matrix proteoglycan 2-like isoform X2 n=1 Tax=Denticeps clupeoides TaxID=299321 RepID=UPI0010A4F00B|nr:interphotoreceptor matrix proteoglycan 2-like isoform X2 [Denticeps clupeoides]
MFSQTTATPEEDSGFTQEAIVPDLEDELGITTATEEIIPVTEDTKGKDKADVTTTTQASFKETNKDTVKTIPETPSDVIEDNVDETSTAPPEITTHDTITNLSPDHTDVDNVSEQSDIIGTKTAEEAVTAAITELPSDIPLNEGDLDDVEVPPDISLESHETEADTVIEHETHGDVEEELSEIEPESATSTKGLQDVYISEIGGEVTVEPKEELPEEDLVIAEPAGDRTPKPFETIPEKNIPDDDTPPEETPDDTIPDQHIPDIRLPPDESLHEIISEPKDINAETIEVASEAVLEATPSTEESIPEGVLKDKVTHEDDSDELIVEVQEDTKLAVTEEIPEMSNVQDKAEAPEMEVVSETTAEKNFHITPEVSTEDAEETHFHEVVERIPETAEDKGSSDITDDGPGTVQTEDASDIIFEETADHTITVLETVKTEWEEPKATESKLEDVGEGILEEVLPTVPEQDPFESPTKDEGPMFVQTPEPVIKKDTAKTMTEEDMSEHPLLETPRSDVQEVHEGEMDQLVEPAPEAEPTEPITATTTSTSEQAPSHQDLKEEDDNMITNEIDDMIARPLRPIGEHVVELSIKLRGESYDDALRDPSSFYYQHLAEQFTQKIEDAFERLPGFKSVFVLEFRPQKDVRGGLAVVVHYGVTLEGDGTGISNETMDYINLQSNMVENSYKEPDEIPTVVYTITDFRNFITEALHKENFIGNTSLDVDPESLQLENVDTLLPAKPTGRVLDSNDLDNVLAAEKPPDFPGQELTSNELFLKKEDFLFSPVNPYDPWIGSPSEVASENDVLILEESPTLYPTEMPDETTIDEEGFLNGLKTDSNDSASSTSPAKETPDKDGELRGGNETPMDNFLDFGSGSGFSGDEPGHDIWSWMQEKSNKEHTPEVERIKPFPGPEQEVLEESIEAHPPELDVTTEEPFLDLKLVTHDIHTHPHYTTTVQAPVFWTMETLTVELSMQTVEASEMYDDYFPSEPSTTAAPVTDTLPLQSTTESIHELLTEIPVSLATEPSYPEAMAVTSKEVASTDKQATTGSPSVEETTHDSKVTGTTMSVIIKTEQATVRAPTAEPETDKWPLIEDVTERPAIWTPDSEDGSEDGKIQILEEEQVVQETLASEVSPTVISQEDLTEDEIFEVSMTTMTPQKTVSTTTAHSTPLSPEKESPFTRVSNVAPEDDITPHQTSATELPSQEDKTDESPLYDLGTETKHDEITEVDDGGNDLILSHFPNALNILNGGYSILPPTVSPTEAEPAESDSMDRSIYNDVDEYENITVKLHLPENNTLDTSSDIVHYDELSYSEDGGRGVSASNAYGPDMASFAMPTSPGRALMVFFSLRVTNMIFSEDLFNKSSTEYKALEQRFLELLIPYLQSNLSNFENLEILNFRNGSIVVNSRMKFGKPVPDSVTTAVYLILEDFCNTAYQTMNLAIDKYSLDVESGEQADPCKFQACNEFSKCTVNRWSGEAECVCDAGYFSMDGLPCQSICDLQEDFCLNDGKCDVIPGKGAICRCRVGENWWYRGEHCEEYVSEPLVVGIAIASVAGFLLVASGVIFFLARTLRDQYDKDDIEDPLRRVDSVPSLERATKYNPMFESDATTGYNHYSKRYQDGPGYSTASNEASTDFSSEEIRHIYENSELTKEEIQDRIRIIELYAKDRQFADFVKQHQVALDSRRESLST